MVLAIGLAKGLIKEICLKSESLLQGSLQECRSAQASCVLSVIPLLILPSPAYLELSASSAVPSLS